MTGAGIMLGIGDEMPQGSLCTTDTVSERIEDLRYTLGEGPCVDAHATGAVITEPDLAAPRKVRWQAFAPPALEAGARAVFGFPLCVGSTRLGALNLYRDQPGPLSDDQYADALIMADVAARSILAAQAAAPGEGLAAELDRDANFNLRVQQAAGMVSVQLGITVGDALIRLRSYAFSSDRPLADVATDVIDRQLRFVDPD